MIRYVRNNFINRGKYDHCVRMDELGLFYGYSWYLDEVCSNWDCLVLNDYDAVWPLPLRVKFGLKYFYRPFAVQQLGFFSKRALTEDEGKQFLEAMTSNCRYADLYLNEGQLEFASKHPHLRYHNNINLTLSLNQTFREIYHSYSKNTRRNISKASNNKLQIFEHDDPERLVNLFKENRGESLNLTGEFYRNMSKAMYNALHKSIGKVWTVYNERNSLCGGIFVIETDKRHTLLFSASSQEGKELRAMYYLINEYLIYSCGSHKIFDFEGSNHSGLQRFYQGFGAQVKTYINVQYNGLPWPLRWLKRT